MLLDPDIPPEGTVIPARPALERLIGRKCQLTNALACCTFPATVAGHMLGKFCARRAKLAQVPLAQTATSLKHRHRHLQRPRQHHDKH